MNKAIQAKYLQASTYINFNQPQVAEKAQQLSEGLTHPQDIIRACFEFVRDDIKHSIDYQLNPVTLKASDVLKHGTGFCYAKSHLLAALLRANGIPTGLCYQRLTIDNDTPPFCLHGLNAVYLENTGWYRLDARGNKKGIDAQFCPPIEKLAFSTVIKGEADLPEVWSEPMTEVVQALQNNQTYLELLENLPDIQLY